MKKIIVGILITLTAAVFISACGPNSQLPEILDPSETDQATTPSEEDLSPTAPADPAQDSESDSEEGQLPPLAAILARQLLADQLDIPVDQVEILASEQAEWSDGCLGLGGPAESCLAVITPGWRVELSAQGKIYIARTDELGDSIRFEDQSIANPIPVLPPVDDSDPADDASYPSAVAAARDALALKLGVSIEEVEIVSYQQKTWPDGCLGLPYKEEMCTMALVSGWQVDLSADGSSYITRTNETGSQIRFE